MFSYLTETLFRGDDSCVSLFNKSINIGFSLDTVLEKCFKLCIIVIFVCVTGRAVMQTPTPAL